MRKRIVLGLWLIGLGLIGNDSVEAQVKNWTTYYSAPLGVYDRLRLVPRDPAGMVCEADTIGTFFSENQNNTLQFCLNPALGYQPVGGLWMQDGDMIYPARTTTNPDLWVGIGTTEPQSRLQIHDGQMPLNWASFDVNPGEIYPASDQFNVTRDDPSVALIGEEGSAFSGFLTFVNLEAGSGTLKDAWFLWRETNIAPLEGRLHLTYSSTASGEKRFWVRTPTLTFTRDQRLGIGVSAPAARLEVNGQTRVSGSMALGSNATGIPSAESLRIVEVLNPVADDRQGINSYIYNDAPFAVGKLFGGAVMSGNHALGASHYYIGAYGGVRNLTQNMFSGSALLGEVVRESAGNITDAIGAQLDIKNLNGAGQITNAYGLYIKNSQNLGTVTNTYGVYIGDLSSGTRVNKPFAVYSQGLVIRNYFAGAVGVGVQAPVAKLQVDGAIRTRPVAGAACVNAFLGTIVYDATTHKFKVCAGAVPAWEDLH